MGSSFTSATRPVSSFIPLVGRTESSATNLGQLQTQFGNSTQVEPQGRGVSDPDPSLNPPSLPVVPSVRFGSIRKDSDFIRSLDLEG